MWRWDVRHMAAYDLPAMIGFVLENNKLKSKKLGLIAHSQGTVLSFLALSRMMRPDLGEKISCFCALSPAVFSGELVEKSFFFKYVKHLGPVLFRIVFGAGDFIPIMMGMSNIIPKNLYGWLAYKVFSFLFNWNDNNWDRGLRARMFYFSPVYISAESMRWWLGRGSFASRRCIFDIHPSDILNGEYIEDEDEDEDDNNINHISTSADYESWFDEKFPPIALYIGGNDTLVNGEALINHLKRREPKVKLAQVKTIQHYEHLDCLWAMDCIREIGEDLVKVLIETAPMTIREPSYTISNDSLDDDSPPLP